LTCGNLTVDLLLTFIVLFLFCVAAHQPNTHGCCCYVCGLGGSRCKLHLFVLIDDGHTVVVDNYTDVVLIQGHFHLSVVSMVTSAGIVCVRHCVVVKDIL